jgi:ABC-type antimicrobial peptide transport system permease subunit
MTTLLYTPQQYGQYLVDALMGTLGAGLFQVGVFVIFLYLIFKTEADTSVKVFLTMLSALTLLAMNVDMPNEYLWIVGAVVFVGALVAAWGFTKLVGE